MYPDNFKFQSISNLDNSSTSSPLGISPLKKWIQLLLDFWMNWMIRLDSSEMSDFNVWESKNVIRGNL